MQKYIQERLISWNIQLTKQVLCFNKLISKEKNHQRIIAPNEFGNKQKIQIKVVITAITFHFIFASSLDFHFFTSQSQK